MTCEFCGDAPKKKKPDFTKAVIEIDNPETLVLLRKVVIPASMGDETDVPPTVGKYRNVILYYEANKHTYLYSSDGIPTLIEPDVPQEIIDRIETLEDGLATETTERVAADAALQDNIDAEESARQTADTALQNNIDAEEAARIAADATLQSDITAEANARQDVDSTLQSNIDAEVTARASADTTLQNNIDTVSSAVTAEATARQNADTALGGRIDTVENSLSSEATTRANADTALGTQITGVSNDLATETAARQSADNNMQSQIDAIVASSDVKDIVGTKAELNNYDTSTLGNNDIIKVLDDETQNDAVTYYRWSTSTQQFTLIGAEGPYYTRATTDTLLNAKADKTTTYTKTETDNLLAGKQGTLTAGNNIQINNNTISATDTTYTAGTGLNLSNGEFSVDTTVIAEKTDLPTVVQTVGTSTTDVMSQNAVTGEIWLDPTNRTHVSIGTKRVYAPNGYGVQIGENAVSSSYAVAIGGSDTTTNASAATSYSVAIGYRARGNQQDAVAIGRSAIVDDHPRSVAIGYTAYARGPQSSAIGSEAKTGYSATSAVALGTNANASASYSIALGADSSASTQGEMNVGTSQNHGYSGSTYRLITGVHDPQSAHDAATKGYVDAGDSSISFGTNNTTYWTHPTTDNSGTVTTVNLPDSSYNRVETSFFVTSATSHSGELYIGVEDVEPGSTVYYRRHGLRNGTFASASGQYSVPSSDTYADAFHTANATWTGLVIKQTAIRIGTVTWMLQIDLSGTGNASTEHYDVQCVSNSATTAPGIYVRQSPFANATGHREGKIWITH